jgi:hypothetical protein
MTLALWKVIGKSRKHISRHSKRETISDSFSRTIFYWCIGRASSFAKAMEDRDARPYLGLP